MKKILIFIMGLLTYTSNITPMANDNFTETFIQELLAEKYDDQSDAIFQAHKKLIKKNIPNLHKLTRLLHLGCKDGKLSAYFAAELNKRIVIGLEYSKKLKKKAKVTYPELSDNLYFLKIILNNPVFNQYFQLAFSTSGLQGPLGTQKALRSIHNTLLPGGELFILTPVKDNEGLIMQTAWEVLGAKHWLPYQELVSTIFKSSLTQETIKRKLEKANFINIDIETRIGAINEENLTRYIERIASGLALSEKLQTQLVKEIVQRYFKKARKIKKRSLVNKIPLLIIKAHKECHGLTEPQSSPNNHYRLS